MEILEILAFLILLFLSGFFSSSETAIFSVDKLKVRTLAKTKDKRAKYLKKLRENLRQTLVTILIWNNFVNVLASALATYIATQALGSLGVGVATGVVTFLLLTFGEITPKTIAASKAKSFALAVSRPLYYLVQVTRPIAWFFEKLASGITWLARIKPESSRLTESEIREAIKLGEIEGIIEKGEKELIENIFEFGDLTAEDIMVPRVEMVMLDGNKSLAEVWETIMKSGFSRFPVYLENKDNIIGILYIKTLLGKKVNKRKKVKDYVLPTFFVPTSKKLDSLLKDFQRKRTQMAIVVNEYGGVEGLVTLEDLLEEIVGEIEDEHEKVEKKLTRVGKGEYLVDAGTELDDINNELGLDLEDEEYNTIGGLVIHKLDRIPRPGEEIDLDKVKIKVVDSSPKRIEKLLVKLKQGKTKP